MDRLNLSRTVWMMVLVAVVDPMLKTLIPFLERDDVAIDGGNSYYHDDIPRAAELKAASFWRRWLERPENLWLHRTFFQIHLWLGMAIGLYIVLMSLSGSAIVFRNQLERSASPNSPVSRAVERLVDFHENLLFGRVGRSVNGIAAICATLLCLTGAVIWWPGIAHWRRSLSVEWRASFARLNWDLHAAMGFWLFLFLMVWTISGVYFAFPNAFNALVDLLDPSDASTSLRFGDRVLLWLSNLHFGRFDWFTEALWTVVGLVPAALVFTGLFMCCHRLLFKLPHPVTIWHETNIR